MNIKLAYLRKSKNCFMNYNKINLGAEFFKNVWKYNFFYIETLSFPKAFKDPQTSQFIFMFGKIREYINELLINENGNFVIQKCLEIYDHQYMKFLLDEIKKDVNFI